MLNIKSGQRTAIYCFYDEAGIADDYVIVYLRGLKKVCKRIVVVVNGFLTEESDTKIRAITDEIIIRENEGFDAWAYKTGLDYIGWDKLPEYEEVILCNSTVFGPVYPFKEMFDKMSEKENLDFWGITFHPELEKKGTINPYGYLPEHVQFYFVVLRKNLLGKAELKAFWDNLAPINNYDEAVDLVETVFTKHFANKGYKWDVYVNYEFGKDEITQYILLFDPYGAVVRYRCPVIKRRLFYFSLYITYANSCGEGISLLLNHVKKNKLYDTGLIYKNIIRTADQKYFVDCFNFRFSLPESYLVPTAHKAYVAGAVVIMFKTPSGNERYRKNLKQMLPESISIKEVKLTGDSLKDNDIILNALSKAAKQYRYVALWNDEEPKDNKYSTHYHSYRDIQELSMFASEKYIANVLSIFENNPHIGLLMPSPVIRRWQTLELNYDRAKEIADNMNLSIPVSCNWSRLVDFGFAWCRAEALSKVVDFCSGSAVFASAEREVKRVLLPYLVQNFIYAPGFISTDELTTRQFARNYFYVNK